LFPLLVVFLKKIVSVTGRIVEQMIEVGKRPARSTYGGMIGGGATAKA
jgi:hypothetical protein